MLKLEMPTLGEILEEAGGNEELLEELLDKFRLWLKQQLHLPQDISEQRLKVYIYSAKFNLEKAKRRLDLHYTLRNLVPEVYSNRDPLSDSITQIIKCVQWIPLPKLTPENFRIFVCRFLHTDSSVFDVYATVKYFCMIMDTRIEEDIVNSDVFILDFTNLTLGHILKHTPPILKKIDVILEAYGTRIKALHMINAPNYVDVLITLCKSVMKPKLTKRIHIYTSGAESLYALIPRSILPVDFGGEQPSLDTIADMWKAKLMQRREWFLEQEKVKVNESLRSNSVIKPDDVFGVSGTFRKLNID
ncbi:retinol-binding protein pinta-like isoform X3 [Cataglyphis hispanica]|uniref:retinol-binding protein pinta-like isoform X3 n=1 Tax=Cataglyphis hispanica TaxID=1086592 RepID=UPI0021802430|nr:retinol-binding protein pinta-like isoform X3 [Cataglyphis hispanica]